MNEVGGLWSRVSNGEQPTTSIPKNIEINGIKSTCYLNTATKVLTLNKIQIFLSDEMFAKINMNPLPKENQVSLENLVSHSKLLYAQARNSISPNQQTLFKMTDHGVILLKEREGLAQAINRYFGQFFNSERGYEKTILTEVGINAKPQSLEQKADKILSVEGTYKDVEEYVHLGGSLSMLARKVDIEGSGSALVMRLNYAQLLREKLKPESLSMRMRSGLPISFIQLGRNKLDMFNLESNFGKGVLSKDDMKLLMNKYGDDGAVREFLELLHLQRARGRDTSELIEGLLREEIPLNLNNLNSNLKRAEGIDILTIPNSIEERVVLKMLITETFGKLPDKETNHNDLQIKLRRAHDALQKPEVSPRSKWISKAYIELAYPTNRLIHMGGGLMTPRLLQAKSEEEFLAIIEEFQPYLDTLSRLDEATVKKWNNNIRQILLELAVAARECEKFSSSTRLINPIKHLTTLYFQNIDFETFPLERVKQDISNAQTNLAETITPLINSQATLDGVDISNKINEGLSEYDRSITTLRSWINRELNSAVFHMPMEIESMRKSDALQNMTSKFLSEKKGECIQALGIYKVFIGLVGIDDPDNAKLSKETLKTEEGAIKRLSQLEKNYRQLYEIKKLSTDPSDKIYLAQKYFAFERYLNEVKEKYPNIVQDLPAIKLEEIEEVFASGITLPQQLFGKDITLADFQAYRQFAFKFQDIGCNLLSALESLDKMAEVTSYNKVRSNYDSKRRGPDNN